MYLRIGENLKAHLGNVSGPIILTGAGGWLGQAALDIFDQVFQHSLVKRVFVYGASAREYRLASGRTILIRPLSEITALTCPAAWYLHFAFLTRDRVGAMTNEAFTEGNRRISSLVSEAVERIGVKGFFLPSSGAVYGHDGQIDDDIERNPYGVLKYQDELRFEALLHRLDAPLTIARIFNLAGPYINKLGTYALASIINDIRNGAPIRIRAAHRVVRSYVHVADVLEIALSTMFMSEGASVQRFDTAGEEAFEITELAMRVATVLGCPECAIERPPIDMSRSDIYVGDGAAMTDLATRHRVAISEMDKQIIDTDRFISDLKKYHGQD